MPFHIKLQLDLQFNLCPMPSGAVVHAGIKNAIQCLCHLWQAVQNKNIGPALCALWVGRMPVILPLLFRFGDKKKNQ